MVSLAMGAAIYARISLDRSEGEGVARQLADCRQLCAERGWEVTGEYVDNDVSAFRKRRRPEWQRLMGELDQYDALVAYHPDRLYRLTRDLEDLIDALEDSGVMVATVKAGDMDLATASGRMVARMLGAAARHESERMAERVRRAKVERATQGRPAGGGKRPTGLDATRTRLHTREAQMLRQVAANLVAGASWTGEVRRLNAEGWTTTTGAAWTVGTLRRTLTNPYVAGLRTYKGQIMGDASWPPIIDRDTFDTLCARIGQPQGPRRAGSHLLTGHIRCGRCGRRMYANNTRTGWTYRCPKQQASTGQGCGQTIMRDPTDRLVLDTVTGWLTEPAFLEALNLYLNPIEDTRSQVELDTVETRLADLARRFAAGDLLELEHAAARAELVARRKALLATTRRNVVSVDLAGLEDSWAQALAAEDVPMLRQWVALVAHPVVIHHGRRSDRVQIRPVWA